MSQRLKEPRLVEIAKKYNKRVAQILIRCPIEIFRSIHKQRINSNTEISDFEISDKDINTLYSFDEYFVTEWDPTRYKYKKN